MHSIDELSDEQKKKIRDWAAEGASLSELQNRMGGELGLKMTFMDARMLIADLDAQIMDQPDPEEEAPAPPVETAPADGEEGAAPPSGISVTTSDVLPPGAMAAGQVTFSDGKRADWVVDQMGQLALDPIDEGMEPSESDYAAFQQELMRLLG